MKKAVAKTNAKSGARPGIKPSAKPKPGKKPIASPPTEPRLAMSASGVVIDVPPSVTKDLPALQDAGAALVSLRDMSQRDGAYSFLRGTLRPRISALRAMFTRIKQGITESHKRALAEERAVLAPYVKLDDSIEAAITAFDTAERERREAEAKRIQDAAEAEARAAEAAADDDIETLHAAAADMRKQAASAQGQQRRDLLAAAASLEADAGKIQEDAAQPVVLPALPVEPPKAKGRAVTHHAEIRDIEALVKAVAKGSVSLAALEPDKLIENHPWLNNMARKYGTGLNIPGVVAVPDVSIR